MIAKNSIGIRLVGILATFALVAGSGLSAQPQKEWDSAPIVARQFVVLVIGDEQAREQALAHIAQTWELSFAPMMLEAVHLNFGSPFSAKIIYVLSENTGRDFGHDIDAWYEWLWSEDYEPHRDYAEFKSLLYGLIDPKFSGYYSAERRTDIRLDEVRWGGVRQDGIPPLRQPKMIAAADADYLDDSNVVFGLVVNGDARAYPKRILAWHEMFVDEVGGESVTGVYCTLCGSMILYHNIVDGTEYHLGTSGFLYRSNKLMYDRATQSLWSTMEGRPVVGPLAEAEPPIQLRRLGVVTSTWGKWRERHPDSTVLSLETGYERDYGEGVAYREYFGTDKLMFNVPKLDTRLKNKAEVVGLYFPETSKATLAISADFLSAHPVYHDKLGEMKFVVVTDDSGANRVYESGDTSFVALRNDENLEAEDETIWKVTEEALISTDGADLPRLPAHRAFWFGWYAAFPETRLVK